MARVSEGPSGPQVSRTVRLLTTRILVGLLAVHLAGILLVVLSIAIEASDAPLPTIWAEIVLRLPPAWRLAAAPLSLVGAMLSVGRMRREGLLLALGSVGAGPRACIVLAAVLGALIGALAPSLPTTHRWERIAGGWNHEGVVIADVPGGPTGTPRVQTRSILPVATSAGASAAGAAVGLYGGVVSGVLLAAGLLVVDAVGPDWPSAVSHPRCWA